MPCVSIENRVPQRASNVCGKCRSAVYSASYVAPGQPSAAPPSARLTRSSSYAYPSRARGDAWGASTPPASPVLPAGNIKWHTSGQPPARPLFECASGFVMPTFEMENIRVQRRVR